LLLEVAVAVVAQMGQSVQVVVVVQRYLQTFQWLPVQHLLLQLVVVVVQVQVVLLVLVVVLQELMVEHVGAMQVALGHRAEVAVVVAGLVCILVLLILL
jgi:hypothetical protein